MFEKKVLYLSASELHRQVIWCEDIGSLNGILNPHGNIGMTGGYNVLLCVQSQDEVIYKNSLYNKCFFTDVTSLNENSIQKKINVYPNPSTGRFYIPSNNLISNKKITVEIYSLLGNRIESFDLGDKNELDLTHYKKGIYIITFRDVCYLAIEKIIIN